MCYGLSQKSYGSSVSPLSTSPRPPPNDNNNMQNTFPFCDTLRMSMRSWGHKVTKVRTSVILFRQPESSQFRNIAFIVFVIRWRWASVCARRRRRHVDLPLLNVNQHSLCRECQNESLCHFCVDLQIHTQSWQTHLPCRGIGPPASLVVGEQTHLVAVGNLWLKQALHNMLFQSEQDSRL